MKSKLIILILLLHFASLQAQDSSLLPVRKDNLWGFINRKGEIEITPAYDYAGKFNKGIAIVSKGGKAGFIDISNHFTIEPVYDEVRAFNDSIYAVRIDSLWGFYHRKGSKVVQPFAKEWYEGKYGYFYAYLNNNLTGVINRDGYKITEAKYDSVVPFDINYLLVYVNGKAGLVDREGSELLPPAFEEIIPEERNCYLFKKGNCWGIVGDNNKALIEPQWKSFRPLATGFIVLQSKKGNALYSIAAEKLITDDSYENFYTLNSDKIECEKAKLYGVATHSRLIADAIYDEFEAATDEVVKVRKNEQWGLMDSLGNMVLQPGYSAIGVFKNHLATIRNNGQYGIVNEKGKIIISCDNDNIIQYENSAKIYAENNSVIIISFTDDGQLLDSSYYRNLHTISVNGYDSYYGQQQPNNLKATEVNEYEWFYSGRLKRYGLKNAKTDSVIIKPCFNNVFVDAKAGRTVVEIFNRSGTPEDYDNYGRRYLRYGVLSNKTFKFIIKPFYRYINMSDIADTNAIYVRCTNSEGVSGIILLYDKETFIHYSYVGDLSGGLALVNTGGKLAYPEEDERLSDPISINPGDFLDEGALIACSNTGFSTTVARQQQRNFKSNVIKCTGGKWGYINRNGRIEIIPQYAFADAFKRGNAIVKQNGKYGVINSLGNVIIDIKYDCVRPLPNSSDSLFELQMRCAKYGFANSRGDIIIDAKFDKVKDFNEGIAAVSTGGKWGFADTTGKTIVTPIYSAANDFSEGLGPVKYKGKWGYVNADGKWEIKNTYSNAQPFREGLAVVNIKGKSCYINTDGKIAIKGPFKRAMDFHNGIAPVIIRHKFGFINEKDKWLIRPHFNAVNFRDEDNSYLVRKGQKYGIVYQGKKTYIHCKYNSIGTFSDGLAPAKYHGSYGYIDTAGRWVIKPTYQQAGKFYHGRASVKEKGKFGVIDENGEWILTPQYSYCDNMGNGITQVRKNGKNALLNMGPKNGAIGNYVLTSDFSEGVSIAKCGKQSFCFIDINGNKLFNTNYQDAKPFKNGFAWVKQEGKWGMIDHNGIMIIEPKFSNVESFKKGFAKFKVETMVGVAGMDGKIMIQPEAEKVIYEGEGVFRIENGSSIGYITTANDWLWAMNK